MLASLLIVFREVIEAGLIVGIVLAATNLPNMLDPALRRPGRQLGGASRGGG